MKFGERLEAAMTHVGWGPSDLCARSGVAMATISAITKRGSDRTNYKESLVKAFPMAKVSHRWLRDGTGSMTDAPEPESNVAPAPMGANRVPVITSIQAGMWAEIVDSFQPGDAGDWLLTDIDLSDSAFALDIRGNSMEPEFKDGDRVIIDPEIAPQPGDFVAAKNGEQEATFKKYRPRGMDAHGNIIFELVPLNDDYPTLRSDVQHIKIVGTMVEHRKYRRPR